MLRISRIEKRTNEFILKKTGVHRSLCYICYQLILQFFAHIIRQLDDNMKTPSCRGKLKDKDLEEDDGWTV